jgi:NAD(P)-dependent dehydrogenase (short-subunit alcohol dehydrogenase family)
MDTALITGISGNLGNAVASRLLADGYSVAGSYSGNRPAQFDGNDRCRLYQSDLTDESSAARMVQLCLKDLGGISTAVLTVGGFAMGDVASTDSKEISRLVSLNFLTAYHVVRPLFAAMEAQGRGRIFLIGSLAGAHPAGSKATLGYGISKAMLFDLASILNSQTGDRNIVTSVIVPSTIDTPQNRQAMPDADFSTWVLPEQIASAISWYAGADAEKIRQPVIYVTGKQV